MTLVALLATIRAFAELATEAIKGMTPEQRAAFLERHERRMDFFDKLFERIRD